MLITQRLFIGQWISNRVFCGEKEIDSREKKNVFPAYSLPLIELELFFNQGEMKTLDICQIESRHHSFSHLLTTSSIHRRMSSENVVRFFLFFSRSTQFSSRWLDFLVRLYHKNS